VEATKKEARVMRLRVLLLATLLVAPAVVVAKPIDFGQLLSDVLAQMWSHGCTPTQKLVGKYELTPIPSGFNKNGKQTYNTKLKWSAKCTSMEPKVSSLQN